MTKNDSLGRSQTWAHREKTVYQNQKSSELIKKKRRIDVLCASFWIGVIASGQKRTKFEN